MSGAECTWAPLIDRAVVPGAMLLALLIGLGLAIRATGGMDRSKGDDDE